MLRRVEPRRVERDDPSVVAEHGPRAGREVLQAGPDRQDDIGLGDDAVGVVAPGDADRADPARMGGRRQALPAIVSTTGTPWRSTNARETVLGERVVDAAARDQHRPPRLAEERCRRGELVAGRAAAAAARGRAARRSEPGSRGPPPGRPGQPEERGPAVGGVEHRLDRQRQALQHLRRRDDPVPVARDARKASLTVVEGTPGCSTCCSTGSGTRLWKVSPQRSSSGSRLASAAPAAVTMFVAPGPIEDVATMICRRRVAFANATAASAMPCSFWPRQVGSVVPRLVERVPRPVTLPCPKIANTPGNSGASRPSTTVRWAIR